MNMSMKSILFALVAVFFVSTSVVKADNNRKRNWNKNHPRRAQVNGRQNSAGQPPAGAPPAGAPPAAAPPAGAPPVVSQ